MKTEKHERVIQLGSRKTAYQLHRVNRRRLRIVVSPELTVDVFAPKRAGKETVDKAIQKKAPWIFRTLDRLETYHPLPSPRQYACGETIVYLGRQYRLRVENTFVQPAKLNGRYLTVGVTNKNDSRSVKKAVDTWYRKRAGETLTRYLEKCYKTAARHGVQEPMMTIRKMRRRWGSCSPKKRITLNLDLVKVPVHCIEYVIMHEICHLKYHNHSKTFYSLLTRCQPDWRLRKATLDRFRLT